MKYDFGELDEIGLSMKKYFTHLARMIHADIIIIKNYFFINSKYKIYLGWIPGFLEF